MEKPANNDYPVHELIERRWSPRDFSEEPVEVAKLRSLFEAARWAPSSYNDQPWYFIVGRSKDESGTYQKVFDSLVEGNQSWAESAPVLGLSVARLRFERNGEPNRHAYHDVGLAMENLVLEALNRELFVHQMAGFSQQQAREHFEIPAEHEPVAAFALGYPEDPENLSEDRRESETSDRSRRSLEESVFTEKWGRPADFVS